MQGRCALPRRPSFSPSSRCSAQELALHKMGACSSVRKGDVMRPQSSDMEEHAERGVSDKRMTHSYDAQHSSASDALFLAATNPAATYALMEGASAVVPYNAVAQSGQTLGAMASTAGHAFVDGSSHLVHLAADAASVALHSLADMGAAAATLGASALHVAADAGAVALHAIAEGGSAALSVASEVGSAMMEHGGAALVSVGEAIASGGAALVEGAVAVGEFVGELAGAVS